MDLTLSSRPGQRCTVVQAHGIIDFGTGPELRQMLQGLRAAGVGRVVLDMTEVRLMDSSGLSVLVAMSKAFGQDGGRLCLAAVPPLVRSVLSVTSVDRIIGVYDTVTAAEQALAADA